MTDEEADLKLSTLLAAPQRAPDEGFAARMRQAVLVEERLRAARRRAWARFGWEMLAAAAAIGAFWLLARVTPADSPDIVPVFSPAMAGLLLLALWVLVSFRGAEGGFSPANPR